MREMRLLINMRHNDARKWLHAALDLLPVLLIPVFMIYSHRHSLTERTEVDIQYKYQTNEVNSINDLVSGNLYHLDFMRLVTYMESPENLNIYIVSCDEMTINSFDDYYIDEINTNSYDSNNFNYIYVVHFNWDNETLLYISNAYSYVSLYYENLDISFYNIDFYCENINQLKSYVEYENIDLPSSSNFNVIENVDVQDTNSDIMSVFMDDFNGAVDKYFNMGNVFNLNGVYEWFNTNIFNGNAPQIIYSVWNIALYELVMDLLFLLYGLFMWFIDMCKHLMEKPFRSIK